MLDDTFVIGDVHGHLDRLEALLKQEGLLGRCEVCQGGGEVVDNIFGRDYDYEDCINCNGMGQLRLRKDVTVVQLGDLGHFGRDGSPTADTLCYKYVADNRWADIVLWGNHDRALVDSSHIFTGFLKNYDALHYIAKLRDEDRMRLAYSAHGFLITHAGLAAAFKDQKVGAQLKTDPVAVASWLNHHDDLYLTALLDVEDHGGLDRNALAVTNAIGVRRGGRVNTGGILWRDIEEKLYDGFRQVFGHSADPQNQVRYCTKSAHTRQRPAMEGSPFYGSYCIDVGGKPGRPGVDCLAGIWLPSEKVVRVDL